MQYAQQRSWADAHTPQVKSILRNIKSDLQIEDASLEQDRLHATDLLLDGYPTGIRVRSTKCAAYSHQLTFRTSKGKDGLTEWQKIRAGEARYWFVGYLDSNDKIGKWYLFDLNVLRQNLEKIDVEPGGGERSQFVAVNIADVGKKFIIAQSR